MNRGNIRGWRGRGARGRTCHDDAPPHADRTPPPAHNQRTAPGSHHALPTSPQNSGYGLACVLQVAVASRALAARGVSPLGRCGLGAFAAHGLWMAAYLLGRDLLLATYR